jgi:hypothetical protein
MLRVFVSGYIRQSDQYRIVYIGEASPTFAKDLAFG